MDASGATRQALQNCTVHPEERWAQEAFLQERCMTRAGIWPALLDTSMQCTSWCRYREVQAQLIAVALQRPQHVMVPAVQSSSRT